MRQRIAKTTTTAANGTRVTKTKLVAAPELEWKLQAAAVRAARQFPEFGDEWVARPDGTFPTFTLAGDMAAAFRSRQGATIAKATGLVPGETDSRWYFAGARLKMIEYKAGRGSLSAAQKTRHALLRGLGFEVVVVKATTEEDAAAQTLAWIEKWLTGCAGSGIAPVGVAGLGTTQAANGNEGPSVGLKWVEGNRDEVGNRFR